MTTASAAHDDVTVLIPLHRSAQWFDVVDANIERLLPRVRMIVSDPFGEDDTLDRLRAKWSSPRIEFVGRRPLERGWVAHYNDLLERCSTTFFLWLAHDDEIDADYVDRCRDAIDADPGATGAFGGIDPIDGFGASGPLVECPSRVVEGGSRGALDALAGWTLGIAFRSVFRTEGSRPIPHTTAIDEWADLVWLFGRLLDGPLVHVPGARYRKRFVADSTHTEWRDDLLGPLLVVHLAEEVARIEDPTERLATLRALGEWSASHSRYLVGRADEEAAAERRRRSEAAQALEAERGTVEILRGDLARLDAHVAEVTADRDDARRAIAVILGSARWRVGGAVVGAVARPGRLLRRLRRTPRRG